MKIKNFVYFFIIGLFSLPIGYSNGAVVTVKKAAPVATKQSNAMESASSLVPTVLGLVGTVKDLKTKQDALTAECAPTNEEIQTVNDLVKEWAKIGDTDAESAVNGLGYPCEDYATYMDINADESETCYEVFKATDNKTATWVGFPKASYAKICPGANNKNCKYVSNIYDVFAKITFTTDDYTAAELTKVAKLIEKSEKCAPAKITAAKREMWAGLLTKTVGNVGASTGASSTESIIQAVSSMGGNGSFQSVLPALGTMVPQILDK